MNQVVGCHARCGLLLDVLVCLRLAVCFLRVDASGFGRFVYFTCQLHSRDKLDLFVILKGFVADFELGNRLFWTLLTRPVRRGNICPKSK